MAVDRRRLTSSSSSSFFISCCFLALLMPNDDGMLRRAAALSVGVNYGQVANNLPPPAQVSWLLRSLSISRVKLYDADRDVLTAFAGSGVDFIVAIDNGNVPGMIDQSAAQSWLQQNVLPYADGTRITCITVGNEVLNGNDTTLMAALLPAMQSVRRALAAVGLDKQVAVTTAHSLYIMATSYPPSAGTFRPDVVPYIQPILSFLSSTGSPFLINCYPYFAYKADPTGVSLDYVLFRPNAGVVDPATRFTYDNMLYAQVDAVYAAMQALGHSDVVAKISETGWPSKGDPNEAGATPEYAGTYIGNLLQRVEMRQGTPMRPAVPIDVYVFALFNENLKPGPTSERNYGLFYPDGTPVYDIGLHGFLPGGSGGIPDGAIALSSNVNDNQCTQMRSIFTYLIAAASFAFLLLS